MSRFQIQVVALAFVMAGLDGFDVLVAAYTAPPIAQAWRLGSTQIGTLLSAGLLGMGLGAIAFGTLSDQRGRRPAILWCLGILCVGMLGSATSTNLIHLSAWRVFTGLGIGGMLANINILVGEFSSQRRRHLAVVIMSVGYPIGATLGGFAAVYLIKQFGWPTVYIFGAVVALILMPVALKTIPESIVFLVVRRPQNALVTLNRILSRIGHAAITELPTPVTNAQPSGLTVFAIFKRPYHIGTLAGSVFYFSVMTTAYFLLSWLPRVMTSLGFTVSIGIAASLLLNIGGVIGCLIYGFLAARLGGRRLAIVFLLGLGVTTTLFGHLPVHATVLLIDATAIGFCLHTSIAALYALVPFSFPAAIRTTGTGFAMSIGRLGAVTGPFVAGLLMAAGTSRSSLFAALAIPMLAAAVCVYWIHDFKTSPEEEKAKMPSTTLQSKSLSGPSKARLLGLTLTITAGFGWGALQSSPAFATETGIQEYPVGVNTVADGNMPPPGMLQMLSYTQYFNSNKLSDGRGNFAVPQFALSAEAEAPRFLYTWEPAIGPFHYTSGIVTPITHINSTVLGEHGHETGVGDINLQNYLSVAAADHSLFWYFGLDLYAPTGEYHSTAAVNQGLNYWTFSPNINVTYNPSPKWEFAGTLFPEFKTKNHATHYQSGDDIDLDYGITYRPLDVLPKFGVGVNGFFYKQYTVDTVNGVKAPVDGHRGQEFAAGPQLRYDIPFGGVVLKWQRSFDVRNRAGGNRFWLEVAFPLFGKAEAEAAHELRPAL